MLRLQNLPQSLTHDLNTPNIACECQCDPEIDLSTLTNRNRECCNVVPDYVLVVDPTNQGDIITTPTRTVQVATNNSRTQTRKKSKTLSASYQTHINSKRNCDFILLNHSESSKSSSARCCP